MNSGDGHRESVARDGAPGPAGVVGVVVIGRNEGERLHRCLASLLAQVPSPTIVYVDSGSTDASVAHAQSLASQGVHVVQLDMATPFTAARARNAGIALLRSVVPEVAFIQTVDGDCEVCPGWLHAGADALRSDATLAAVSGRLRERFPGATLYNRLADLEWDRPAGEEKSCGGVAMFRASAVAQVGGFDATLIAGEEPELCARLRAAGFRVLRIAHEMALHDIAMTSERQWLTRARRHGHAIVEVSYFKTSASRDLFAHHVRSALAWSAVWWCMANSVAAIAALGALRLLRGSGHAPLSWSALGLCCAVPFACAGLWVLQGSRIAKQGRAKGLDAQQSRAYGALMMNAKLAQLHGMASFLWKRLRGSKQHVIDYRTSKP